MRTAHRKRMPPNALTKDTYTSMCMWTERGCCTLRWMLRATSSIRSNSKNGRTASATLPIKNLLIMRYLLRIPPIAPVLLLALWLVSPTATVAQEPIVRRSLVFPIQHQHVHGSSLVALPNGDLLIAWFQGSGERNADDVRIMGARQLKGAKEWSDPFELADTPHLPDCNPVLFMVGDRLFLVWIAVQANRWENSILRVRTTTAYAGAEAPAWEWQDNILLKPDDGFAEEVAAKLKALPPQQAGWAEYAPRYDQLIMTASQDAAKRSTGWMT